MPRSAEDEPRPLPPGEAKTPGEVLVSLPRLTPEEADSFAEDLRKVRTELNRLPTRDPWEA